MRVVRIRVCTRENAASSVFTTSRVRVDTAFGGGPPPPIPPRRHRRQVTTEEALCDARKRQIYRVAVHAIARGARTSPAFRCPFPGRRGCMIKGQLHFERLARMSDTVLPVYKALHIVRKAMCCDFARHRRGGAAVTIGRRSPRKTGRYWRRTAPFF